MTPPLLQLSRHGHTFSGLAHPRHACFLQQTQQKYPSAIRVEICGGLAEALAITS